MNVLTHKYIIDWFNSSSISLVTYLGVHIFSYDGIHVGVSVYCFSTSPFDILFIIRYIMYGFLGHLSHLGDLLLWVGVRRPSSVVRRALTSSSQELLDQY